LFVFLIAAAFILLFMAGCLSFLFLFCRRLLLFAGLYFCSRIYLFYTGAGIKLFLPFLSLFFFFFFDGKNNRRFYLGAAYLIIWAAFFYFGSLFLAAPSINIISAPALLFLVLVLAFLFLFHMGGGWKNNNIIAAENNKEMRAVKNQKEKVFEKERYRRCLFWPANNPPRKENN